MQKEEAIKEYCLQLAWGLCQGNHPATPIPVADIIKTARELEEYITENAPKATNRKG